MEAMQLWAARIAGAAGVLLSLVAVVARLAGQFWIGGLQTGTLLQAGIAAMVAGCLAYVALLAERSRAGR
ncbi:MAG: hypothetical protein E6H58_12595 [Betaproteobacteria bacterium]|jgi:hypothetical protein|nr:MAG: hypothetical protein E6H58_12595 [Betaproteobacteria bacterium]